jgi:hypothetical protein
MSEEPEPIPLFEETQEPPWPFMALGLGSGAAGGFMAFRSWNIVARLGMAGAAAGGLGLLLSEVLFPMRTSVLSEEVQVRFGRRTRFRIPLRNVTRAYPRTYDPLREYGGWGIRIGPSGRAFNLRGKEGVQLVLRSGQRVLIGSQQAGELADVIRSLTDCESEPEAPEETELYEEQASWADDESGI